MISKKYIYAVVGVSRNPEKYGHRVFKDLIEGGYQVFGVNPKADTVLDKRIYPSLENLPKKPDVVILVAPPNISEKVIVMCNKLGINKVWMQPGSENQKAIDLCKEFKIECIHDACIMIERKKSNL